MNVALTATTRDLALSSPAQAPVSAAQPAPAPAPEVQRQDTFGPATRVAISSTPDPNSVSASAARVRAANDAVQTVVSVDPETKSLVYQARDESTGAVVSQYPDEAKLRLRAYIDELTQQQTQAATAGTHPDPAAIDGIRI